MGGVVTEITAKVSDEACNVDVLVLHETLEKLPAETYLALYKIMTLELSKVYPPVFN